ncbi:NfeD family protein [Bacillus changyiensis]|uniref:NfeD family protein n=1 Tax=Bacillus changyiensis TaxID=3004103 RepID=UPI0022E180F1|nr:nodulation protein NfeD [Bacillus changyiensis]MDA1474789.1 nodulation protein NfeD [Bacillus changyiensis]
MLLKKIKLSVALICGFGLFLLLGVHLTVKAEENTVYVIPVEETVEKGLSKFLERSFQEAKEMKAKHIILDINTPGGAVDAALKIADTIHNSDIPVTAYVNRRALSAGAYLALNADDIYMAPGGKMGAAAIIDTQGNAADKKAESLWLAEMEDAAKKNGRDPKYALAMADADVDAKDVGAPKGELLTLSPDKALKVGYSEGTVSNLDDLLKKLKLQDAKVEHTEVSFAEKVARFITHPVVVPILLSIGSLGLVVELYSPGFGIPGFMGLSALMLFFYGHLVAGLAGMETLLLFITGIILIILEFFVPGGIVGIIGIIAVIASLFLASGSFTDMAISILIAIAVSVAASILLTRVLGKRMNFFKKLILTDSTNSESGYISNETRHDLIGQIGITFTPLRPSGTVIIGDERLDVVSEGSFTAKDKKVKVVKVEGSRIVVREI